jgi:hypothetical protein
MGFSQKTKMDFSKCATISLAIRPSSSWKVSDAKFEWWILVALTDLPDVFFVLRGAIGGMAGHRPTVVALQVCGWCGECGRCEWVCGE